MKPLAFLLAVLSTAGCSLNLVDPSGNNLKPNVPVYTGSNPNPWYIYADALSFGDWLKGTPFFVWNGAATQAEKDDFYMNLVIDPNNTEKIGNGLKNLKISYPKAIPANIWGGGIGFVHVPDYAVYAATPGKDIRPGNYTKCRFSVAGLYNRQAEFIAQGITTGMITLQSNYQSISLNLPAVPSQSAVKDFLVINVSVANTVGPFTIYIDDLRYE